MRTYQDIEYENRWTSDSNLESLAKVLGIKSTALFKDGEAKSINHLLISEIMDNFDEAQAGAVLAVLKSMTDLGKPIQKAE